MYFLMHGGTIGNHLKLLTVTLLQYSIISLLRYSKLPPLARSKGIRSSATELDTATPLIEIINGSHPIAQTARNISAEFHFIASIRL